MSDVSVRRSFFSSLFIPFRTDQPLFEHAVTPLPVPMHRFPVRAANGLRNNRRGASARHGGRHRRRHVRVDRAAIWGRGAADSGGGDESLKAREDPAAEGGGAPPGREGGGPPELVLHHDAGGAALERSRFGFFCMIPFGSLGETHRNEARAAVNPLFVLSLSRSLLCQAFL